jgi:hypothetical protein
MGRWSTTDCQPDEQDRLSNSAASQGIRRSAADAPKEQEVEAAADGVGPDNRKDVAKLIQNPATIFQFFIPHEISIYRQVQNKSNKLKTILTRIYNKAIGFYTVCNITPQLITAITHFILEGGTRDGTRDNPIYSRMLSH